MRYFLSFCVVILLSTTVVNGQVSSKMDPLWVKFDQMKGTITNFLAMLEEQSARIKKLESDGQASDLITALNADMIAAKNMMADFQRDFSNSIEELETKLENTSNEQAILEDRVENLEQFISELPPVLPGEVLLEMDGRAKLFSSEDLVSKKSQLPSYEKCSEFGPVLENTTNRRLNSFFAVDADDKISMCKFVLGSWQHVPSSSQENGHAVVISN